MENLTKNNFSKLRITFTFLLFSLNPCQSYCLEGIENVKVEQEVIELGNTMASSDLTFYGSGFYIDKEFHYLLENNPTYTMELSVALNYFWCGRGAPSLYIKVDSHDSGNEGKDESWECGVGVKNYTLKDAKTVTIQLKGRWGYYTWLSLTVTAYYNTQDECPEEFNFDCHYPTNDSVLGHHCIGSKLECNGKRNCYSTDEDEQNCDIVTTESPDRFGDDFSDVISTVVWVVIIVLILLLIGGIVCCCACCCGVTFGLAKICAKCRSGSDKEIASQNDSNLNEANASNINPGPVISYYNEMSKPVDAPPTYDQAVVINSEKDGK